jgi:hypothetical protein
MKPFSAPSLPSKQVPVKGALFLPFRSFDALLLPLRALTAFFLFLVFRPLCFRPFPHELFAAAGLLDQSRRLSSNKFHGNHSSTFPGGFPPAAAHAFK